MIVTQIAELTKTRSKVFLDGEFAFVLYKGELRLFQITLGEELKQEYYEEIMHNVLPKRAKLRSMNLLKSRDYTEAQLIRKLKEGGYPKEVIAMAVAYVKDFHYIDDRRYAIQYISYHSQDKSRKRIMLDLQNKGIAQEIAEFAYEEVLESGDLMPQEELIMKFLQKKHYDPQTADYSDKQKIYRYLLGKGFTMEQIRHAIGELS
ncbi:MAG: RecX family transcriptional regulator [Lachnospiraceae bacterium]|nr:RecX family transcriptional regulator [Lachnospiraceae bacterium]MDD6201328.1 RecX family transcriptional regulator [Lachnospiraceae bacterium]